VLELEKLKTKSCFIYPISSISEVLKNYLENIGVNIIGFVDSYKTDNNLITPNNLINHTFDYVIIFSPNHYKDIFKQLQKYIKKDKILLAHLDSNLSIPYTFITNIDEYIENNSSQKIEVEKYFIEKSKYFTLENEILFIGISFIDLNIKYLYFYLRKYTKYKIHIATNNNRDIELFKSIGINVIKYPSIEFVDLVFKCKIKIIDQNPLDNLILKSLSIGKSIQLWHGITIESLGVLTNYKALTYDVVLSTSKFVTDYSFSKIYKYKKIIHCGYPRNDVITHNDIQLFNIEEKLLSKMKEKNSKYVIYMPTHRKMSFKSNPINYIELDRFAKEHNIIFIIKMHPFATEMFRDDLTMYQPLKEYKNLVIYPSHKDIYPLFQYSDLMIADYSSAYFDYLFANKPIVFFPYDFDEWVKSENGIILDYKKYIPGDMCYTFDELKDAILKNLQRDNYKKERKIVFDKMFSNQNKKASLLLMDEINKLMVLNDE